MPIYLTVFLESALAVFEASSTIQFLKPSALAVREENSSSTTSYLARESASSTQEGRETTRVTTPTSTDLPSER